MEKITAFIIGAGSIGALKPDKFDSPASEHALTHANAIFRHPRFQLVGISDKDEKKRELAEDKERF